MQQVRQAFDGLDFDIEGEIVNAAELSNAAQALERLGFQVVRIENGVETFATMTEVAGFLASALDQGTISATELRQVVDALAGQRQSEALLALIHHFDEYQRALASYADGAGSAMREAELAAQSWEGRLNALNNAWTRLFASATDVSGFARNVVGATTNIVEGLGSMVGLLNTVPGQFILATTVAGLFGVALQGLTASKTAANLATKLGVATNAGFTASLRTAFTATVAQTKANAGLAMSVQSVTGALIGKAAAWAMTPMGMAAIAIGAIVGITTAINNHNRRLEENAQIIRENAQRQREATESLREQIDAFDELNNRRMNAQNFAETRAINEEILDLQIQIVNTIGSQASEIDLVNGRYSEQVAELREILRLRNEIDLANARSAMNLARNLITAGIDANATTLLASLNPFDWSYTRLTNQLSNAGVVADIYARIDPASLRENSTWQLEFQRLSFNEQYEVLLSAQNSLNAAARAGENYADALAWVVSQLEIVRERQNQFNSAVESYRQIILDAVGFQFPDLLEDLFNIDGSEQSFEQYREAVLARISSVWDEVSEIVSGLAETPIELAVLLGINIDADRLQRDIENVLGEAIQSSWGRSSLSPYTQWIERVSQALQETLSREQLDFVINMDYDDLVEFMTLVEFLSDDISEAVDWLNEFRNAQESASRETRFQGLLETTREQVVMLQNALAEQNRTGTISAETYAKIASAGEDFTRLLTTTNGVLGIATQQTIDYSNSLVGAAIHTAILGGATEEQIDRFLELYVRTTDLNSILDEIMSSYSTLARVLEEYNETGYVTLSTLQAFLRLSPEYLKALDLQNGQLIINEERVRLLTQALKEEAITKLRNAAIEDIRLLAMGRAEEMSVIARDAVSRLGDALETTGDQARDSASGIMSFNSAVQIAMAREGTSIINMLNEVEAIANAYEEVANRIRNINVDFGGLHHSSGRTPRDTTSATARETEPFYAEIAATRLLEARLQRVNELLTRNNNLFNEVDGNRDRQAELLQERIDLLREQQSLLHDINNTNRGVMIDSIARFAEHGINVSFVPELNKMAFEQTVEEIQSIINNIRIGDQEETNAVRREMESMLDTIIRMNEANDRNSTQWLEIQRSINQINMDLINMDFSGFMGDATRELEDLNFQMNMLAESDVAQRIDIISRRLEIQQSIITRTNQQYQELQRALMDGRITSEQFTSAIDTNTTAMQNATLAARRYAEAITQIQLDQLNQQQSAMMDIVDLTRRMIQQEARNEIDGLNNRLRDIQAAQNALRDMERDLNDNLRDRNQLRDDEIRDLNEALRLERERARDAQDRLRNELAAYRDLINLRRRELSRQSEDRRFEQDLSARQLEVQRIQNRLDELANNDSLAARAERARLNEELARRQQDLDNLVHQNELNIKDRALQDELDRFQRQNQAEQDAIAAALLAFERAHQERLGMIDAERRAHQDMVNSQIEELQRQRDAYDAMADNIRDQIADIQDRIARNGDLTRLAMQRIDEEGERLYKSLILWNERYGTGIREDISGSWESWLRLVDTGNKTTLSYTRQLMRDILNLSLQMVNAQHQISTMGNWGIRSYFEWQGRVVDWNQDTRQFSIDGNWFDSSSFVNLDGRLQATYHQLRDLERQLANLPRYDKGGFIDRDQLAVVHAGERVLTVEQNKAFEAGGLHKLMVDQSAWDNFGNMMRMNMLPNNAMNAVTNPHVYGKLNELFDSNNMPTFHIEQNFDGVTSESFIRDLPHTMKTVVSAEIKDERRKINKAAWSGGLGTRIKR